MTAAHRALALASLLLLSACGSRRDPKVVEIATFADPTTIPNQQKQLDAFCQKNGLKARLNYVPYGSFTEKIITQMAAGTAPDLLWVEVGFYVDLQTSGVLKPLDEFITKDKVDLKQYYDGVMSRFRKDGKVWALPNDTAPVACLFYNKAMFKEAKVPFPSERWTWKDLLAAAQKLTKRGEDGRVKVWGYKDGYGPDWMNWVMANGGAFVDDVKDPKKCLFDSPQAIEGVQFLVDLLYKHKVMMSEANRELMGGSAADMFKVGKLAMFRSGYWNVGGIRKEAPDLDWDIAPFPKGPRAKRWAWTTGGSGWAMTRDARDPEAAWKVLRFFAGEEYQRSLLAEGGYMPGVKSLAKSKEFLQGKPANSRMMLWTPDYSVYSPEIKEYSELLYSVINPKMDNLVMQSGGDVAAVMKEITAEVDKRLAARRK